MNSQFDFIERPQSQVSLNSEKSPKVRCANWMEEVRLRQSLKALTRQENSAVKRIFHDQKMVVSKFRQRISRTIGLLRIHEELKVGMTADVSRNSTFAHFQEGYDSHKLFLSSNVGKASILPPTTKEKSDHFFMRPFTANDLRVRTWERKIQSISSSLQRAQSAPRLGINSRINVDYKPIRRLKTSNINAGTKRSCYKSIFE